MKGKRLMLLSEALNVNETERDVGLNDLLLFFPIHYSNFINFIFKFINDDTPRTYIGILIVLKKHGPMPISHIGERMSVAKSNMTALIDGITRREWIKRCISSSDRRVTNIELTEKGMEYIEEITTKINTVLRDKLSVLSGEETVEFMRSVDFLTAVGDKVLKAHNRE